MLAELLAPRKIFVVYCRVSAIAQEVDKNIEQQFASCIDKCRELINQGYKFLCKIPGANFETNPRDAFFYDQAYNLEKIDPKTEFYSILELGNQLKFDYILTYDSNRINRSSSAETRGRIQDILEKNEINVITITNGIIPTGLLFTVKSAFDAEDKKQIMQKLHHAKKIRAINDNRPTCGKCFFGFNYCKYSKKWILIDAEIIMLKSIFSLAIGTELEGIPSEISIVVKANPGGLSDPKIADVLNSVGLKDVLLGYYKRTNQFKRLQKLVTGKISFRFIENIYKIDRYRGFNNYYFKETKLVGKRKATADEKQVVAVQIPRIISDEIWQKLRSVRLERQVHAKRNLIHQYLLRGILVCESCGVTMACRPKYPSKKFMADGTIFEPKPIFYYADQGKQKISGFKCSASRCHNSIKVDEIVWNSVKALILDPKSILELENSVRNEVKTENPEDYIKSIAELDKKISALEAEKNRLTTLLVKSIIEESDYVSEKNRIDKEIYESKKLQAQLQLRLAEIAKIEAEIPSIDLTKISRKYKKRLDELDFDEKRQLITILLKQVKISITGEIKLVYKLFTKK